MPCQILESVRSAPSAVESFLVKLGCAISRTCGKRERKSRFPRVTFCEGLIPGVESPFLGLANIEVTNNHTKSFRVAKPVQRNKA